MAVYVMSDLHGNYEGFMSILKQIKFSEKDELYVDELPPHTRDFSRELGGFTCKNGKHMV